MYSKNLNKRIFVSNFFTGVIYVLSFLTIVPLFFVLYFIFIKGVSKINLTFLTEQYFDGGIGHAIIGTLMLIVIASLIAIPIGIILGIFLSELKKSKIASLTRTGIEILQAIPSIVIGILAYIWIAGPFGFSAIAGGIALAIMMLPVIAKSTEETLLLIPSTLKEASMALGVPYWKTILKVIVPAGISGIITGCLVGIARIAGETAPLLFTAFFSDFFNYNPTKPVGALPTLIFKYATDADPVRNQIAWGASFILVGIVLFFNISAKILSKKWKVNI